MSGNLSGGEVSGYAAAAVVVLAAIGSGIKWLLNWKGARDDSRAVRLAAWQSELEARERRIDGEQAAHFARLEERLERTERQMEVVLNGYHLLAGALRERDPANPALAQAEQLLQAAFRLDPFVPTEMAAVMARIGTKGDAT